MFSKRIWLKTLNLMMLITIAFTCVYKQNIEVIHANEAVMVTGTVYDVDGTVVKDEVIIEFLDERQNVIQLYTIKDGTGTYKVEVKNPKSIYNIRAKKKYREQMKRINIDTEKQENKIDFNLKKVTATYNLYSPNLNQNNADSYKGTLTYKGEVLANLDANNLTYSSVFILEDLDKNLDGRQDEPFIYHGTVDGCKALYLVHEMGESLFKDITWGGHILMPYFYGPDQLTGLVINENKQPIENAEVILMDDKNNILLTTRTGVDGKFKTETTSTIVNNKYKIYAKKEPYINSEIQEFVSLNNLHGYFELKLKEEKPDSGQDKQDNEEKPATDEKEEIKNEEKEEDITEDNPVEDKNEIIENEKEEIKEDENKQETIDKDEIKKEETKTSGSNNALVIGIAGVAGAIVLWLIIIFFKKKKEVEEDEK